MAQPQVWASSCFYRNGEGKEFSTGAVVSGRGGAVLEHGNLFKGRAAILADAQNGDIIVLSQTYCTIYKRRLL
jgi:hypothetical protein